jgi:DNA invertase Pin-like site-specific DNA recombinase
MSKPKAYSYIPFSTAEQAGGDSSRRQSALAKDYAARHGLELDDSLTFRDLGISAYRGHNAAGGALADFLAAVKAGVVRQGSFLLVESLDRISRQTARKALRTLEDIVESGVTLVTLTDQKTYTSESIDQDQMSLMWALMVAIRAHEESAMKGRRLKAAWEGKRARAVSDGKPLTATCPGWLTLV